MKKFLFSLLIGLTLVGCSSEEAPQRVDSNQDFAEEAVLTIISNTQQIGASELSEYAGKVLADSGSPSRSASAATVTDWTFKSGLQTYRIHEDIKALVDIIPQ